MDAKNLRWSPIVRRVHDVVCVVELFVRKYTIIVHRWHVIIQRAMYRLGHTHGYATVMYGV